MNSENILKSNYKLPAFGVLALFFTALPEHLHNVYRLLWSYQNTSSSLSYFQELMDLGVKGCQRCLGALLLHPLVNVTGAGAHSLPHQPPQEMVAAGVLLAQGVFLALNKVLCSSHHNGSDIRFSLSSRAAFLTDFCFMDFSKTSLSDRKNIRPSRSYVMGHFSCLSALAG